MTRYASMLAVLGLIFLPAGSAAQDTVWNRYTLEDLGGVFVSAQTGAACAGAGVTDESVRVQAEAALATAEVELLTQGEMLRNPGLPELRIMLECTPGDGVSVSGALAYSVSARVHQSTQMTRDNQITLSEAVTWFATELGVAAIVDAQAALEAAVTAKIDEFATAYKEANGGGGGSPG
jgi:hypothetical protein